MLFDVCWCGLLFFLMLGLLFVVGCCWLLIEFVRDCCSVCVVCVRCVLFVVCVLLHVVCCVLFCVCCSLFGLCHLFCCCCFCDASLVVCWLMCAVR